jgi:hypothetical protein
MVRTNEASSKWNNLAALFPDRHFSQHQLQPLFGVIQQLQEFDRLKWSDGYLLKRSVAETN